MIGFTAKITRFRLIAAIVLLLIPFLLIAIFNSGNAAAQTDFNLDAGTAQQRIDFLKQFGWECDEKSEEVKTTVIPSEFDEVYSVYNELQIEQDFDLGPYKGQSVELYSIKINNYPQDSEYVYASLLVKDGKVIGGDIHSVALDGFMHGFELKQA